ncbi:MAG: hypothetical protein HY289_13740 [Planctomycetes bacterium]|nr:hypothetical protein [Planctomycetota bacterium]
MNKTITGHFDGTVIVLDKPVKLPVGKRLRIKIELAQEENGKKNGKPRKIKITGAGQFDSGISDLATNKKHMEGFGKKPLKIIGTGEFASGIPDLSTNKKHMEGFGKS